MGHSQPRPSPCVRDIPPISLSRIRTDTINCPQRPKNRHFYNIFFVSCCVCSDDLKKKKSMRKRTRKKGKMKKMKERKKGKMKKMKEGNKKKKNMKNEQMKKCTNAKMKRKKKKKDKMKRMKENKEVCQTIECNLRFQILCHPL